MCGDTLEPRCSTPHASRPTRHGKRGTPSPLVEEGGATPPRTYDSEARLDPTYAAPHSLKAVALENLTDDWMPPRVTRPQVRAEAAIALRLDPADGLAYGMKAYADWPDDTASMRRGFDLAFTRAMT